MAKSLDGELNSYTFGLLAERRLRGEFPDDESRTSALLLFLHRVSSGLTTDMENKVHKPMGLTSTGYRLLFGLWIAGDLEPARIAELTSTSRAFISNLSNSFIDEGLVTRRPSERDRRSVVLSLTPKGRDKVRTVYMSQADVKEELFGALNETEQEILQILLAKMLRARAAGE